MDAKVTVEFEFLNVCDEHCLDLEGMTFDSMVRYLIFEEGLIGVVNLDNYIITKVEEI